MTDVQITIHEPEGTTVTLGNLHGGEFFRWPTVGRETTYAHVVVSHGEGVVYYRSLRDNAQYSGASSLKVNKLRLTAVTFEVSPC